MTVYTFWGNKNESADGTSAVIVQSGEIAIGESGDLTASEFAYLSQNHILIPGALTWTRKDFPWTRIDHGYVSGPPHGSANILTQIASDSFLRANGSIAGSNGWLATSDGSMVVASNEASGVSAAIAGNYRTETYSSDQYSQCVIGSVANISADFIGLTVRHNPATNAEYAALYFDNAGVFELDIYFRTGPGVYTKIGGTSGASLPTGTVLTFIAIGSQLIFQVNGATVFSIVDTTLTGGVPGITSFGTVTLDQWQGGNAAAGVLSAALASDDFNRANGNMSSGQVNWSPITVPFSGVACADPVIVSNQLNVADAIHHAASRLDAYSNDHWSAIKMGTTPLAVGSAGFVGTLVRWNGAKGYLCCIFGNPISYRIYSIQTGSNSVQLASASTIINPTGTEFKGVAKGSRISLCVGGAEVLAVTDTTCPTGVPALQIFPPSTSDNWSAGNV